MASSETQAAEINWDLVRKRNFVERLKAEKGGLDVIRDLPAMIEAGYEEVPEEDFVRMQWYGLYHDKPKVGYFMLRVKLPGGQLTPAKLRTMGELSRKYGRGYGEVTTRQNIQLHWVELSKLPEVLSTLDAAGLTTVGACGDNVRSITGCPVAGIDGEELFEVQPLLDEATDFFIRNREYSDLPRKHKITISACPHQCNAPDIHCIALLGVVREGRPGFAVKVGGGLSTWPRLADDLGVWVPAGEAVPVLQAILDVWRTDLKYRMSRAKARLKFMVNDLGPEALRARVEERLGRPLADGTAPSAPEEEKDHTGIHPQKQDGLFYAGFPVYLGLMNGETMLRLADIVESCGGGVRLTRRQNFIVSDIPAARLDEITGAIEALGFPREGMGLRGASIACTGDPFCNYTVAETKTRLQQIVEHLEATFGQRAAGLRINLDGCPHSCAHHWIGDIGLQGTTLRERGPAGERIQGYDLFLRGGLGRDAAIGRPVLKRVPGTEVHFVVERLFRAYLDGRQDGERIQQFFTRHSDEDLLAIGQGSALSIQA
ncbi:MAG TPA: nitrite/sulfite reductase [Thermoanaerobaculia bacterium]